MVNIDTDFETQLKTG